MVSISQGMCSSVCYLNLMAKTPFEVLKAILKYSRRHIHTLAILIRRSANDETGKLGAYTFVKCVINNLPF